MKVKVKKMYADSVYDQKWGVFSDGSCIKRRLNPYTTDYDILIDVFNTDLVEAMYLYGKYYKNIFDRWNDSLTVLYAEGEV